MPRNMDQFGADDMVIPELKLIQNVGGESAKEAGCVPGDLFMTIFDQVYQEGVDVVIVDMQKTRTFWGRDEIGDGPPQCSSSNADTGLSQDGKECATCTDRCDTPWLLTALDRRTKCLLNYHVLAINLTGGADSPLIIRAGGISTKAVRELNTQLKMNKALKQAGLHRGVIHISSDKKKTATGEAFALKFRLVGLVNNMEQAKSLLQTSVELLGVDISEIAPVPDQKRLEQPAEKQNIAAQDVAKMEDVLGDLPEIEEKPTPAPVSATPSAAVPPAKPVASKPKPKVEKPPVTYQAF